MILVQIPLSWQYGLCLMHRRSLLPKPLVPTHQASLLSVALEALIADDFTLPPSPVESPALPSLFLLLHFQIYHMALALATVARCLNPRLLGDSML